MAVTGVMLFGYVVGHLLGNLQIYSADPEQINRYAAFLHNPANAVPLWGIRALLLACVVLHCRGHGATLAAKPRRRGRSATSRKTTCRRPTPPAP